MPGVDLYHRYSGVFKRNYGIITRSAMFSKAFRACVVILSLYLGNTNCSQKYYAVETLEIFPEVKGKIVYRGEYGWKKFLQ
jgi:hypothetical protein